MIYLDYAATYPYVKYPSSNYGPFLNPNANYAYKEKRLLSKAENRVKKAIGAKGGRVIFGGTSSQLIENLMNSINRRYTTISSIYEHESFYRYGFNTVKDLEELKGRLPFPTYDNSTFVLWQAVQNITGEIFPIKDIGHLCHKYNAFYICDATALLGHTTIDPNIDDWCDFLVLDGHKVGTELGIGCCWVSDRLDKWLNGFKLHGTPNLAGALAMAQAVERACDISFLKEKEQKWYKLMSDLYYLLKQDNPDVERIGDKITSTLAINAIRLPGFNADALQQYLASKQVYISVGGSACAERRDYRVLENGYNLTKQEASEVIRVSFGENSTFEDIKTLVENICEFKKIYLDN